MPDPSGHAPVRGYVAVPGIDPCRAGARRNDADFRHEVPMRPIAPGIQLIDVEFQGHPRYIGCYVLDLGGSLALVDPGPGSTLENLESGLEGAGHSVADVAVVLLTHIHLDHAGASGSLVEANPDIDVHVHVRGARHMIDPERLLASAERLYGERMDELWGEFLPVPEDNVVSLSGGEILELGDRRLEVAYTPGHASHHVSYLDLDTRCAFVGDVAGIRIDNAPFVLPVTPPPDIDLEAWEESHRVLEAWAPRRLCPTHFGPAEPVGQHLAEHRRRLAGWAERVRGSLAQDDTDEARAVRFRREVRETLVSALGEPLAERYLRGGGLGDSWRGLSRYFRKRRPRDSA